MAAAGSAGIEVGVLAVTEDAAAYLYQALLQAGPEPGHVFRLRLQEEKFVLAMDVQRTGDRVFTYERIPILSVEESLCLQLAGLILDLKEGAEGKQLSFRRMETSGGDLGRGLQDLVPQDALIFWNGKSAHFP